MINIEEARNYNVMINGKNLSDQPIKNNLIPYENIERMQLVKEMIMQLVLC